MPASHSAANWPPQKSPSPINSSSLITSVSSTPTSSASPLNRMVYVRAPFQPAVSIVSDASIHTYPQPFISVTTPSASSQGPGTQPKTDAIQLLRNLTTVRSSVMTVPAPVRPGPVPPQLIRGGAAPPPLQPSNKLPLPPLRMRPPPRLTAAPGIIVSSEQLAPTTFAVVTCSSSSKPTFVVSSGSQPQPQPQMMTLPVSLLSHLNLSQPLAVKLNNAQVVVPPSCIISTKDGLKVVMLVMSDEATGVLKMFRLPHRLTASPKCQFLVVASTVVFLKSECSCQNGLGGEGVTV